MATRSTQQTVMIGAFESMTSDKSSPQVRACLKTLKELGAVYDATCIGSNRRPLHVSRVLDD
eukprot:2288002-Heterocapsa_arctica.AAC.1